MAKSNQILDTYLALRGQLVSFVMNIVPPKEVEDIIQETYVRMCQVKNKGAIREPRSYLFRTARNLAYDHMKRAETRLTTWTDQFDDLPAANFGLSSESDSTYAQVASDEEFALFCEAVRELPKQCRHAFILKKVYGYTLKEIMLDMGIGQSTVETHIVNGTKKCVKYLRDRQEQRIFSGDRLSSMNNNAGSSNNWQGDV